MQFSVIVCTYNYGRLLGDALRSLAAQTICNFELLIVDDGSTDHTEEVVRRFKPNFSHCVYIRKSHTGLADSRNVGTQAATGTHVAFLDADDLWSPQYLAAQQSAFEKNPHAELVCCDGFRIRPSGEIIGPFFPPNLPPICGAITTAEDLFSFFPSATPSAMVVVKRAFDRFGPFDVRFPVFGQDWHWLIRAVSHGICCYRLERRLVLYRVHGANLTSSADAMFQAWLQIYGDALKDSRTIRNIELYARRFTRRWLPGLLAAYPARHARALLRPAIAAFPDDTLLRAAYSSTYLGMRGLFRFARGTKHFLQRRLFTGPRVDLNTSPAVIFEALDH